MALQERLEKLEEEICEMKNAAETFDVEKAMAVSDDKVVACWELMREWLNHQTDSWEPRVALEQYRMVKTSESLLQGFPAPSFED